MRRVHRDAERDVDDELVAADGKLRRILLGQRDGDVHDRRHRVAIDEQSEAAFREPEDRRARGKCLAQLVGEVGAEELALLVTERGRNTVERVELT